MYCRNCGNEIKENEKFCSKCGSNLQEETTNTNSTNIQNSVIDNENYTIAEEYKMDIATVMTIVVISFAIFVFLIFAISLRFGYSLGTSIGIGLCIYLSYKFGKPLVGKCPYCGGDITSFNKEGFDCDKCNKRIIVVNNKEFHKVK